eukprot:257886_1
MLHLRSKRLIRWRTHSEYWEDNITIDYGAQWIHNVPSNGNHPLLKMAKHDLNINIQQNFLQTESNKSKLSHRKNLIWDEMSKQQIATKLYTKITHIEKLHLE